MLLGKPDVYGAVFRFEGQASVFDASRGPCYRCLYPEPPPPGLVPTCAEGGVLGVLPGIVGSLQALEALKLLLGIGEGLVGRLLLVDGLRLRFRELELRKDPSCPVCGERPTVRELIDYQAFCGVPDNTADVATEITPAELLHIPLGELPARLRELDSRREIVTVCHHGRRSLKAREVLKAAGFAHVRSLKGGIDAWAREVDLEVARY